MKAKDIEPGKVYLVEYWRARPEVIGKNVLPFLVDRVERSEVRRGAFASQKWGGDTRAYGLLVDPLTLEPKTTVENSFALSKVLRLYDPSEYIARRDVDLAKEQAAEHGRKLAERILAQLATRGLKEARYDGSEIRIPRSAFPDLLSAIEGKE